MTYRQLRLLLDGLNDEQLNDDITVYLSEMDEYFAVDALTENIKDSVLHQGHIYLIVDEIGTSRT